MLPLPDRLSVQCVHGDDIGNAYRLAALEPHAEGAYNIAADPVLDPDTLAKILGARRITVPEKPVRIGADLTWRAHLQPAPAGWVDMGLAVPTMDTSRAPRAPRLDPDRSTPPPPCASSWPACASPRASTPHRCAPTPAAPCASASSSPASAAEPKEGLSRFRFRRRWEGPGMATTTERPLAVVTGASSGIGYELARQFATNGFDLIVAAEDDKINDVATEFAAEAVQVDLATDAGVDELATEGADTNIKGSDPFRFGARGGGGRC